jgi:hypothetical protein
MDAVSSASFCRNVPVIFNCLQKINLVVMKQNDFFFPLIDYLEENTTAQKLG